jgi:hypothetical protein
MTLAEKQYWHHRSARATTKLLATNDKKPNALMRHHPLLLVDISVDDVAPGCAGTSTTDLVVTADEGYRSLSASRASRPLLADAVVVNVPENQNEPWRMPPARGGSGSSSGSITTSNVPPRVSTSAQ